jgi:hypothetical protein
MEAYYEEKLKDLQNNLDMTIICKDKMEFKCNTKILKSCSQYFKDYIETYPGKSPDFSEGEIIVELRVVRDSISILNDLSHIDFLITRGHDALLKIIEFLHFLLLEEPILNKIIFKFQEKGYTVSKHITCDALSKTWNSTLIESKLAKFLRFKILSFLLKEETNKKYILEELLKNHIDNNKIFKDEYQIVTYLI